MHGAHPGNSFSMDICASGREDAFVPHAIQDNLGAAIKLKGKTSYDKTLQLRR